MRTIKFRGKTRENGKWYYGSLVYSDEINAAIYFQIGSGSVKTMDWGYVNQETVGQFSGLYDYNGNEIYEGDILKREKDGLMYVVRVGMFYASVKECKEDILGGFPLNVFTKYEDREYKIVGNIYDNPELLKGGEK